MGDWDGVNRRNSDRDGPYVKHFDDHYSLRRQYEASELARDKRFDLLDVKVDKLAKGVEDIKGAVNMLTRSYQHDHKKISTKLDDISKQTKRTVSHLTSEAQVRASVNKKILDKLDKLNHE